jgi:hypothetical protein
VLIVLMPLLRWFLLLLLLRRRLLRQRPHVLRGR